MSSMIRRWSASSTWMRWVLAQPVRRREAGEAEADDIDRDMSGVEGEGAGTAGDALGQQVESRDQLDGLAQQQRPVDRRHQELLAFTLELAPGGVDRADQQGRGAGRLLELEDELQAFRIDPVVLEAEDRGLPEPVQGLVDAADREVGAGVDRRRRQLAAEAVVEAPGVVSDQRQVMAMGRLSEGFDVGGDAVVGRGDMIAAFASGWAARTRSSSSGSTPWATCQRSS